MDAIFHHWPQFLPISKSGSFLQVPIGQKLKLGNPGRSEKILNMFNSFGKVCDFAFQPPNMNYLNAFKSISRGQDGLQAGPNSNTTDRIAVTDSHIKITKVRQFWL